MKKNKTLKIPYHIGVILDGNRRWARQRGLSIFEGHKKGAENLGKMVKLCIKKGIKILTVYAFSTENQKRSKPEIDGLIRIFKHFMKTKRNELDKIGVKLNILGDLKFFPEDLQEEIKRTVRMLKNNKKLVLNMALNYGGRQDIVQAVEKIIKKGYKNINEELISQYLYTAGQPDPDLIIRPGGEMRLSNFLIWQASYSELYFTKVYWPDFSEKELDKALAEYTKRERRFGK